MGIWIGTAICSGELFSLASKNTIRPINLDECEEKKFLYSADVYALLGMMFLY